MSSCSHSTGETMFSATARVSTTPPPLRGDDYLKQQGRRGVRTRSCQTGCSHSVSGHGSVLVLVQVVDVLDLLVVELLVEILDLRLRGLLGGGGLLLLLGLPG